MLGGRAGIVRDGVAGIVRGGTLGSGATTQFGIAGFTGAVTGASLLTARSIIPVPLLLRMYCRLCRDTARTDQSSQPILPGR